MKRNIIVQAVLGCLAFSARLLVGANPHTLENSDAQCLDERCPLPEGSYVQSCTQPKMAFYPSPDPYVPTMCELTTTCKTYYESMPPVEGTYYLPMQTFIRDVSNVNGTLYCKDGSVLGKPEKLELEDKPKEIDAEPGPTWGWQTWNNPTKYREEICQIPYGSYEETCDPDVKVKPYVSTDLELQASPFCIAETTCKTLRGKQKSSFTVYCSEKGERFENCDGVILVHPEGRATNVCAGKTEKEIQEIVNSQVHGRVKILSL